MIKAIGILMQGLFMTIFDFVVVGITELFNRKKSK